MKRTLEKASAALKSQSKSLSDKIKTLNVPSKQPSSGHSSVNGAFSGLARPSIGIASLSSASSLEMTPSRNIGYLIFRVIDYLKKCDDPQSSEAIFDAIGVDVKDDDELKRHLVNNPKVSIIDDKYAYKPMYDVKSEEDLLNLIKNHWTVGNGGVHVKDLQDGWRGISQAIQDLEDQNKIFLYRKRDGSPWVLFYNDMPEFKREQNASFVELWERFSLPKNRAHLQKEMQSAGLSLMEVQKRDISLEEDERGKKKRRKGRKNIKITNTHLKDIDLSVDYVPNSTKR